MDDGYFGFDVGTPVHAQLWWFPEYDTDLGLPKGKAQGRGDGTWTREFQNGMVVVNPTDSTSTISFAATYQNVATGDKGTDFTVQPQDGGIFILAR